MIINLCQAYDKFMFFFRHDCWLSAAASAVTTTSGPKMALGRPAYHSGAMTTYYGASVVAANAVDNNTDGDIAHGSVSLSDYQARPWWSVDLGLQLVYIQTVILYSATSSWSYCEYISIRDTKHYETLGGLQ